jgi:hypothetical protein
MPGAVEWSLSRRFRHVIVRRRRLRQIIEKVVSEPAIAKVTQFFEGVIRPLALPLPEGTQQLSCAATILPH